MNSKQSRKSDELVRVQALMLVTLFWLGCRPAWSDSAKPPEQTFGKPQNQLSTGLDSHQQIITKGSDNVAQSVADFVINAPPDKVWHCLTDFPNYPRIFSKIKTCHVTKQQGDLVWVESDLKPHMFVHKATNYTLNDLKGKPNVLDWQLLDGNFQSLKGKWVLAPEHNGQDCRVTYTLQIDPGPVIPGFLMSYFLKSVQKKITLELKNWVETGSSIQCKKSPDQGQIRS